MLTGVKKLPVRLSRDDALKVYKNLAETNKKIGRLDAFFSKSIVNESLISLLSYNESVQSTRIEGTQVTFHEILENKEKDNLSWQQQEVINYKNAIDYGFEKIKSGMPLSTRLIKELHEILMSEARGTTANVGEFRKVQNFIGPDDNIKNASYIPVPANEIESYMENLDFFINSIDHSSLRIEEDIQEIEVLTFDCDPLLKMAIAHAQFESIHPFLDGNGRLGRILIALLSVYENLMSVPLFFVSEELEKERIRYYNSLNETRGNNPNWGNWLNFFLKSSGRMADHLISKLEKSEELARRGLEVCEKSSHEKVWIQTFQLPILTANQASQLAGIHNQTARKSLDFFTQKGFLEKDTSRKRNVKYYNYDLIRAISE